MERKNVHGGLNSLFTTALSCCRRRLRVPVRDVHHALAGAGSTHIAGALGGRFDPRVVVEHYAWLGEDRAARREEHSVFPGTAR